MKATGCSAALVLCMKKPQHQLCSSLFLEQVVPIRLIFQSAACFSDLPTTHALKDFLIFSFPQNSITHCSCNHVCGSLKRAQLHSYSSLESSFLSLLLCLRLPPNLNLLIFKAVHLSLDIRSLYKDCAMFCSYRRVTETVLLLLNWNTCSQECTMGGGGVWGSRNVFCPTVCARETKSRINTVHTCVWFCCTAWCSAHNIVESSFCGL